MSHAHHEEVPYHGTFKGYVTGFVLAIILTVIPFAMVMKGGMPTSTILVGISLAAFVQVLVHLYYFLHLDASPEQRDNVQSFMFTGFVMVIFIVGTVWIMYNLRIRMMDDMMPMPEATTPAVSGLDTPTHIINAPAPSPEH